MRCIICHGMMGFFLKKTFGLFGLAGAEYWRCNDCGFVRSKTHVDMVPAVWERLNVEYHATYQGKESDTRDQKWRNRIERQALMLYDARRIGLLNRNGRQLDYACGDGKLSDLLRTRYGMDLLKYERYMPKAVGYLEDSDLVSASFNLVVTTSVFEHFLHRAQFDFVESLVRKDGVLGIHTLVCESVPADQGWFYMDPAHCAFFTNRSMEILFQQWGFSCSVYNVDAQLWLWFKTDAQAVETIISDANRRTGTPVYVYKRGFVDYWKCVPLRREAMVVQR